jgi:thymidylate synthase (FAD)
MHTANLIWITPDAEALIAKLARVSNPENEDNPDYKGLIKYLIKHKHWSPFEMASMCVEIRTTRAISPQILRHRSFSFQEFSQRYAEAVDAHVPQLRRQDKKNRQNSTDDLDNGIQLEFDQRIHAHFDEAFNLYQDMLASGIAKECSREVLPLGTETRLYMSGTIRSWLHYIDLRGDNGTQREHMSIARSVGEILATKCPLISRAMWD